MKIAKGIELAPVGPFRKYAGPEDGPRILFRISKLKIF
jgi:hypothetical protein